jgi:HSP20 family protein
MAEPATKLPIREDNENAPASRRELRPMDSFERAVDRFFDDFGRGFFGLPFRRPLFESQALRDFATMPASDVAERDNEYEVTIELPGMEAGDIDVRIANHVLTVTGEKKEEREEKKKDYFLSERRYGSFRRSFQVPAGVDAAAIAADFSKGVLTLTLPKSADARKSEKKIEVKTG